MTEPGSEIEDNRDHRAAWIAAGCLVMLLGKGLFYLYSNQHQYFLLGLRLSDTDFIPKDWFTWHTTHYHQAFGCLLWFLNMLGNLEVTTIVAEAACMLLLSHGLQGLSEVAAGREWRTVYTLAVLWIAVSSTYDMDLGYLSFISGYLQPSEVAGACLVAGIALFARERLLAAGLLVGLSGLFHGSLLLSSSLLILFLCFHVLKEMGFLRCLRFALPVAVLWGVSILLVILARWSSAPGDERFLDVLFHFRSPHHYDPTYWPLGQVLAYLGFAVLGTAGTAVALLGGRADRLRLFLYVQIISLAMSAFGAASAWLGWSRILLLAVPWRIAPLAFVLGLMVLAAAFDHPGGFVPRSGGGGKWSAGFFRLGFLAAGGLWAWHSPHGLESGLRFGWLLLLPVKEMLDFGAARSRFLRPRRPVSRAWLVLPFILALIACYNGIENRSNIFGRNQPRTIELVPEVERKVPNDAVLVVPPTADFAILRTVARRALVVDFKCFPIVPSEIKEWYTRLSDTCGISGPAPPLMFLNGYLNLDANRAAMLRRMYGATHVVVFSQGHRGDLSGLVQVGQTKFFRILEIPPSN